MKIALLSGASSIHTIRWANGLNAAGHEVHVISQHADIEPFDEGVEVHGFPYCGVLGYFLIVPAVRRLLKQIRPDVVNAHYASGYGTTARLTAYRPCILSVWGSDVYGFPYKTPLHRRLVRKNLRAADCVASTSHAMAAQTRRLLPGLGDIAITPFGVDFSAFDSAERSLAAEQEELVIGTVKVMADKYGIDTLIKAFASLYQKLQATDAATAKRLRLRLVGDGPKLEALRQLAARLGVEHKVTFVGRVPHDQVPTELGRLDIYVALSRLDSESFGVAIVEASAAERPVIVSDAGGLPEVVHDGVTGLVVPREDPQAAAEAMEKLLYDPALRRSLGQAGRHYVKGNYSWDVCVDTMLRLYEHTIDNYKSVKV